MHRVTGSSFKFIENGIESYVISFGDPPQQNGVKIPAKMIRRKQNEKWTCAKFCSNDWMFCAAMSRNTVHTPKLVKFRLMATNCLKRHRIK
jgi:hypothetical protein